MKTTVTLVGRKDGSVVLSGEWSGNLEEPEWNAVFNEIYSIVARYGFGVSLEVAEEEKVLTAKRYPISID